MYIVRTLSVALVLVHLRRSGAAVPPPTYVHTDPGTGTGLTCARCPAGTHMEAHCTATSSTLCVPCKAEHYTEFWNYLPRCLYCNVFCTENLEVESACSPVRNRACQCKQGYHGDAEFCTRHSACGPGRGVKTNGTSRTDTVCERCPGGYFSGTSSAREPCVKHRACDSNQQTVLLRGSSFHDTVCGSCGDLKNGSEVSLLRTFLPGFFALHRMHVAKLKRFISRNILKTGNGEERHCCDESLPRERGVLLGVIRAWLAQAPEGQLRRVPEMLRAAKLSSMANKLERGLRELQEQTTHCN